MFRLTLLLLTLALYSSAYSQAIPDSWWNNATFYEIFVRSFNDSDGDGIGDFQGIIQKLDHLNDGDPATTDDLGITGIWLMPINPSPSYHGYDVTDYFGINPDYGTLADFQQFIAECDARGIKVIIDFVGNHSSEQHPYFVDSASDPAATYRDWFNWSDTNPGGGWHLLNGAYYYGLFWSGMPDWNVTNQNVVDYHYSIVDFWLTQGVSGFRYDAVKHLVEEGGSNENTPGTFAYLENFYAHYKGVDAEAICVGEAWSNTATIAQYGPPHTDFCFEFGLSGAIISSVNSQNPNNLENSLNEVLSFHQAGAYAPFLSNHDQDRVFSQFGSDNDKMKLASAIYLTLPGVPFIYYGEEIGMTGTGSDPNKRTPMQWADGFQGGFTTGTPWAAVQGDVATQNVAVQTGDPNSILNHYREFVHLRNNEPALRTGDLAVLNDSHADLICYVRHLAGESVLVVHNLGGTTVSGATTTPSGFCQSQYNVTDLRDGTDFGLTAVDNGVGWPLPESIDPYTTGVYKLLPQTANPCPVNLTIAVDMAGEITDPLGVFADGNFDGWTSGQALTQNGTVWSTTLSVEAGSSVNYRFRNGTDPAGSETVPATCAINDPSNGWVREVTLGTIDATLDPVCFSACDGCYFGPVDLTFLVNLEATPAAPEGVHIAGNFQGWDPSSILMTNVYDNMWSYTHTFEPGTAIEFKYINGDAWGEDESVPAECASGLNRFHTVGAVTSSLEPVCYGSCSICYSTSNPGCTDNTACNYDSAATIDDGSCDYSCYGCMDALACNFNSAATQDDGTCDYSCYGCIDPGACNYNTLSTLDDGSCDYSCLGCTDPAACNYNPTSTIDDGSCIVGATFCGTGTLWDPATETCIAENATTCATDLNGDGLVNTPDLLMMLGAFGSVCP